MRKKWIWGFVLCLIMVFSILGTPAGLVGSEGDSGKNTTESQELKKLRDPDRDSVETYKDLTKLLITLATGALVLVPTLFGLFKSVRSIAWGFLIPSLILFVLSIGCGLLTFSSLAGTQHANEYNIDLVGTRIFAIPQWIFFGAGLVLFIFFALITLSRQKSEIDRYGRLLDLLVAKEVISHDDRVDLLKEWGDPK